MVVGEALDRLVSERGWESLVKDAQVVARFDEIVGEDIAAHANADSFDDGTLVIQAVDGVWATQLRILTVQLLTRFAAEVGAGVVRDIVVRGPGATRPGRRRLRTGM
jgi:predicted nucleic acid-binding Zn ribbon protein